jgi:hypothetical protein
MFKTKNSTNTLCPLKTFQSFLSIWNVSKELYRTCIYWLIDILMDEIKGLTTTLNFLKIYRLFLSITALQC